MKITVTFDTLEEFQTYMGIQSPSSFKSYPLAGVFL